MLALGNQKVEQQRPLVAKRRRELTEFDFPFICLKPILILILQFDLGLDRWH